MTVLVALGTKDSLVMGCDSLGSTTKRLVDPFDLLHYFNHKDEFKLKLDKEGKPTLSNFSDIYNKAQIVPFNHMTHMTKIFSLEPLKMGIMTTGIVSIGERTIKSLISEFKSKEKAFSSKVRTTNYTVNSISKRLLTFINKNYLKIYGDKNIKPVLELMVGGYDKQKQIPSIYRIYVHENKTEEAIKDFGIAFGGQMQEIQRIVFGTDVANKMKIVDRMINRLNLYHSLLEDFFKKNKIAVKIPKPIEFKKELNPSEDWDLDGFDANWGDFSEQNAIECVNFFVNIMIKSQQFSNSMPTVGGNVHIALITKEKGFRFISREEYEHEGYMTPIWR